MYNGPQALITQPATAALQRIWARRTRTTFRRQRCNVVLQLCMLSVAYLVYVWAACLWEPIIGRKKNNIVNGTGTYVRNKASRTETREIVLSTPAEKKSLRACHALQSARVAPAPRPVYPVRVPVSTPFRTAVPNVGTNQSNLK